MTTQLAFKNTQFTTTRHSGQIWLRGTEIAKALGMEKSDAVSQIYNRNSDEFTEAMTLTLKLSVKGFGNGKSAKAVRVFSLRGAHLIAMFARTPVAKEFRRWVLDILDRTVGQPTIKPIIKTKTHSPRYYIKMTLVDRYHKKTEVFEGTAETVTEIVSGTASLFGMHIKKMIPLPANGIRLQVA